MAKVRIKGIESLKAKVKKTFDDVRKNPKLLTEIGELALQNTLANVRSGRDPESRTAFKGLSPEWKNTRDYLKRFNSTGEFFLDSSRSNLTFTGQLLEALGFKIKPSEASVVLTAKGTHRGYKTKNGRTKSIPISKLVDYIEEQGRPFFSISSQLRTRINVLTKRFIRAQIKKDKLG